jgi:hypothetical protein
MIPSFIYRVESTSAWEWAVQMSCATVAVQGLTLGNTRGSRLAVAADSYMARPSVKIVIFLAGTYSRSKSKIGILSVSRQPCRHVISRDP